jgi:hypothetical protein
MLIANGVDVDARDEIGATCLHYLATALGDGLESALRAGADVNARDNNNMTPLHYAMVKQQSYSSVFVNAVILLFFGADIHAADNDGTTICHAATKWVTHVYDLQVRLLLPALLLLGADFDAPNNNGVTPRMLASEPTKADFDIMRKFFVGIVRRRAFQVCLGLQSLRINSLQTCEILMQACGPFAVAVPFHAWWKIATTVKHFHAAQQPANSNRNVMNE